MSRELYIEVRIQDYDDGGHIEFVDRNSQRVLATFNWGHMGRADGFADSNGKAFAIEQAHHWWKEWAMSMGWQRA